MENEKFYPTTEWMQEHYDKLNQELFNGELGECILRPFTSGIGSQGGVLGWFKITGNVRIYKSTRRMFIKTLFGEEIVNETNFVTYCKPCIELNANYAWLEEDMEATLAHEMCHYYTYMRGYAPKQGHGVEFKRIGAIVSARSNGKFSIQRLASAEQCSRMELRSEIKAKKDKRLANKKSKTQAIFVYRTDGVIELTTTSSVDVMSEIVNYYSNKEEKYNEIIKSNDTSLIDFLFSNGYKKDMRTWRLWRIQDKPWAKDIKNYDYDVVLQSTNITIPKKQEKKEEPIIQAPKQTKKYFIIKTMDGEEYKTESNGNEMDLLQKLKERFPLTAVRVLKKLILNPKNYITMSENRKNVNQIIENTINKFLLREFNIKSNKQNEVIEIDPNDNLGLHSPLEYVD